MHHNRTITHTIRRSALWLRHHIAERTFLLLLAVIIGLLTGLGAYLLKSLIALTSRLVTSAFDPSGFNWNLLVWPVAGILLTVLFVRYILKLNIEHGVSILQRQLAHHTYTIPGRVTWGPIVASSLTLGLGGSAGAEGPIAYTGAAIGSNIGKMLGVSPHMLMILIGCGAGAGIAGIFKAPIGGALFALECLGLELSTAAVMALLASTITSAMVVYMCMGWTLDLSYTPAEPFQTQWLPYVICLGIFCGIYSIYYSHVCAAMERRFAQFSNRWLRSLTGGVILAVSLFMFPCLYGEGYSTISHVINGQWDTIADGSVLHGLCNGTTGIIIIAAGIIILKCVACTSSNSSGGVAGDFAPTLFAGCIAGLCFALSLNCWMGLRLPVAMFAFMAMAGVMSGAIGAPLMAIFITVEMTGAYSLLLPVLIVAMLSYGTMKLLRHETFMHRRLNRRMH